MLLIILSLLCFGLFAETVTLGNGSNAINVLQSSDSETVLQYKVGTFEKETVEINGEKWFHVNLPKEGHSQDKGFPQLPVFNRSVVIPGSSAMHLEIYDVQYEDIILPIAPSKGVITRDINPATVPYTFDNIYKSEDFYPTDIASLSDPYIMRDFRGITINTTPFAYQPSTQTLRVYTSFKIRVYANGTNLTNALTTTRDSISRSFMTIYENHFVNWNHYRYTPVDDSFGKLLVICHSSFMNAILPYVNWKKQKGIDTELVEWSTIGTTAAQLQTYIQNKYNADNSLTFVQIVGDAPQIPTLSHGGGGADPVFSLVAGNDNYPDIFIGRFSAQSTSDVTAQINKVIASERDFTTSDTWLRRAMGIASDEGGSGGDNGESDIQHMNVIRNKLLNYGYTSVDQVYDPGASASTVTTNVNAGRAVINYVGHGADTYWVTTYFNNTHATNLSNGTKAPVIMDVACVNGNFVSQTCFAEAWQRNANGGSVAMYASTINQSWASPMRAQDEFTDLLIANSKTTLGGLYYNSSCNMMDNYGSDGVNMFKTWHIFGDASMLMRTKTPVAMNVTHPATIMIGGTTLSVNTGVANALVAVTYNNTIYGRAVTNSSGTATIMLSNPPSGILTYTITATAFDRVTYVGTINQIAADGPYMSVTNVVYADSNNNQPEYNEAGRFNVTFKNYGNEPATNVTATLTCSTAGITITDNSEAISSLASGANLTRNNAFAFNIANNVVNGTIAQFTITMVSGSNTWEHQFTLELKAPALEFGEITISDPTGNNNGGIDPGETFTIRINLKNTGAAVSPSGTATIFSGLLGLNINPTTVSFPAISASGSTVLSFNASCDAGVNAGTLATLNLTATAGAYSATGSEIVEIGAPTVVTIGTGTSTQSYPLDRYYNYSTHEALYLASELTTPGSIKTIAYQKASGTDVNPIESVKVYMKNTTDTTMSGGTYSLTGYTLVYEGNFPNDATSGWMEVELDTRFAYAGNSLSILVVKDYQYWTSNYPYWTYTTATANRARQNRNDNSQPTSLSATTNLPNMRLKLFPSAAYLAPPQNLTASPSHRSVKLDWQAPVTGNPTGYKIYKNNNLLTTVTGFTYTDTAVTNGTTYSYYLKATYSSGDSDVTDTVTATPNAIAPTNLSASAGNNSVYLEWTASTGREVLELFGRSQQAERALSGYKIYRDGTALTTVTSTTYTDTAVTNGTTYSYYVAAVYTNPAGESAASNTATATPAAITSVVIGTGTSSTSGSVASPINVYYQSLHGQSVYTQAELNAAGVVGPIDITQIGFNVTGTPNNAMPNFIVRMGHTTATNVSSWIAATSLTQVSLVSSYQPTSTGWDMITLDTPFRWNGSDNIVIDTAFGLIGSYNSSGTVQYSTVSTGYRYARSDGADQTNVFTGYNTSNYRPNVQFTLLPIAVGPAISTNPESITAETYAGESKQVQMTIYNSGTQTLNWSTPSIFGTWGSISPASGNIAVGQNRQITVTLDAASLSEGSYSSSFTITSNAVDNAQLVIPVSLTVLPAPEPVRFVAEWEPAKGAVVAYVGGTGFGLPTSVLADLSTRGKLYVLVTSSYQNTARNQLQNGGATMSNVEFVVRNGVNTYWTRDYAPWTVFNESGEMAFVDFEYNRPRPYDNAVPAAMASYLDMDFRYMPLTTTGGNTMTDGMGKMMSTNLVLTENSSFTTSQIEAIVKEYLGVDEYITYADPLINSTIDHMDCHAKLLDVDKVMVARVPQGHQNYNNLETVANLWASKISSYGTPYRVYRVDQSSNNEPYANSFIYNDKIYVPQWNSSASSYDTAAIAAYQAAMPGYTVQGYYNSSWLSDDALHCRVNTVFDPELIHISHTPLTTAVEQSPVAINVDITHTNNLNPSLTRVAYRHGTSGLWQYAPLSQVNGNEWTASITTPSLGQTLYYYIQAQDVTGRKTTLPLCAANEPFQLTIDQALPNQPPVLNLPDAISFPMTEVYQVDFAQYASDPDGDALTLTHSGNTNILISIQGLNVTFSAVAGWYGTEDITFTLSDGIATVTGVVPVTAIYVVTYLDNPQISVDKLPDSIRISWEAVEDATKYLIYRALDPYGDFSLIAETSALYWVDQDLHLRAFYYVKAVHESVPALRNK